MNITQGASAAAAATGFNIIPEAPTTPTQAELDLATLHKTKRAALLLNGSTKIEALGAVMLDAKARQVNVGDAFHAFAMDIRLMIQRAGAGLRLG